MPHPALKPGLTAIIILLLAFYPAMAQRPDNRVQITGAMKNVMWKGQLYGNIALDTIGERAHLYGFGPVEYLTGELLIIDGRSYRSTVLTPTTMRVEETYQSKAPFFGHANINHWVQSRLPDSVRTLPQLETYLNNGSGLSKGPFMFKVSGRIETANIHIVNLPPGSRVSNPDEAHQGQTNYHLQNEAVDLVGFFSTAHKAIFTHHDSFMHIHLITTDRKKMGHLEEFVLQPGTATLYLPAE